MWKEFTSSARTDGLKLSHWSREDREKEHGTDYYFARYNKAIEVVTYDDEVRLTQSCSSSWENERSTTRILACRSCGGLRRTIKRWRTLPVGLFSLTLSHVYIGCVNPRAEPPQEYQRVVECMDTGADIWSRKETDHLMELAARFDLRFVVMHDRWDLPQRSVEQLKHRYYSVARALLLSRCADPREMSDHPVIKESYNFNHEIQRKRALSAALGRTRAMVEEDKRVIEEAARIRERRKEEAARKELLRDERGAAAKDADAEAAMAPARELPRPDEGRYLRGEWAKTTAAQLQAGAGARSAKRVEQLLREYGLEGAPTTPTKAVSEAYLSLAIEIIETLEIQKRLARVETELQQLRNEANAAGGAQLPDVGMLGMPMGAGALGGALGHSAMGVMSTGPAGEAAATPAGAGRASKKRKGEESVTPRSDGKRQRKAPRLPGE